MAAPKPIRRAWKFCPRCGTAVARTGRNPFRCGACGFSHYFAPVAAVGSILTDPAGQVLLLVRAKDPGKGLYGLPGGFVDAGETIEQALRREVLEEIGLQVRTHHYLASFPNEYAWNGFVLPVTDVFFVVEVESFADMRAVDGEITGWKFCRPGRRELNRMAFLSNRLALELYLQQTRAK